MDTQAEVKTSIPVDEPAPTPPPEIVKTEIKQNSKMPVVPLLVVLLVLALGAVAFLVYQNMQLSKQITGMLTNYQAPVAYTSPTPSPIDFSNDKKSIIDLATNALKAKYPGMEILVGESELKVDGDWGHGTSAVIDPKATDGGADLVLFIAHKENGQWRIILETDSEYKTLFQQLPDTVVSKEVKDFYKNNP